jgi:hypothetical protein
MKKIALINKKLWAGVVALLLVAALTATALAVWPSFQNDNTNNGVIAAPPGAPPPIASTTTARTVALPAGTSVYSGVDTTSVVYTTDYTDAEKVNSTKTIAYTLYDSGTGANGGARVAATDLVSGQILWTRQLNTTSNSQISTPYLNKNTNTLYAGVTEDTAFYIAPNFSQWSATGGASIGAGGVATFAAGQSGVLTSDAFLLNKDVRLVYTVTNINVSAGETADYSIQLTGGNTPQTFALGSGTIAGGQYGSSGTYDTVDFTLPPIAHTGQYTLKITVTPSGPSAVTASKMSLTRYDWQLFKISSVNTANPTVSSRYGPFEGQLNTPISYDNSGNIYFGIWGALHQYLQYNMAADSLGIFTPSGGNENFYGAGAACVTISGIDYMVFGSDSGKVYVVPVNTFSTSSTAHSFTINPANPIRSSVAVDSKGEYAYFTSRFTNSKSNPPVYDGWLYQVKVSSLAPGQSVVYSYVPLTNASTSTPAISDNGYVYVGTYEGFTSGTVEAYIPGTLSGGVLSSPTLAANIYTGDPVQSSAIVWTDKESFPPTDYIYFTTNSNSTTYVGSGYCYSFNGTAPAQVWNPPTAGSNAELQGMAYSDVGGYVVWGDDSNNLYIIAP